MSLESALAAVRFGLGAGPGEMDRIEARGPRDWLWGQFGLADAFPEDNLKSSKQALIPALERIGRRKMGGDREELSEAEKNEFVAALRDTVKDEFIARTIYASRTTSPFRERLTQFWSNHFSVSGKNAQVRLVVGAFEREAIRPSIMGSFEKLLIAAILHPAMLIYLDNVQSVGPNSRAGRRRDRGLNENLAREVLELHTVTPASGYTQEDVTEFARALTGWTVGGRRFAPEREGETAFFAQIHEPGARTILGRRYGQPDGEQAVAVLKHLAAHPATARHVAFKLARHFVADDPPAGVVARLEGAFLDSGGDLQSVYRVLIEAPEAWAPELVKLKTPNDLLTSASRGLGVQIGFGGDPKNVLQSLAQPPFSAPSPEGWPDTAEDWLGPDAMNKRIEWANRVATKAPEIDARDFLEEALGPLASAETRTAVARAESPAQALALALMSPEFQRR